MRRSFAARLIAQGPGGALTKIDVPFDVERAFGSRGRVSVKGAINGFSFRTSIFRNGDGTHHMMVNKAMKEGGKVKMGDAIKVTLEPHRGPKIVEVPIEMKRALARNKAAHMAFEKLAPSHPREYIRHGIEAKKPETRQRRIEKMIEKLLG